MVAEQALDIQVLKAINAKNWEGPRRSERAAQWSTERFGLSQRRMCRLLALDRNTLWYCSQRQDDAVLRTRNRAIAE